MRRIFLVLVTIMMVRCDPIPHCKTQNVDVCDLCDPKYFSSEDKKSCLPCDVTCALCENTKEENVKCTQCVDPNAVVDTDFKNICNCKPGYFVKKDFFTCVKCELPCNSCQNKVDNQVCLGCVDPHMKVSTDKTTCECEATYYMDINKGLCNLCLAPCELCINIGTTTNLQKCTQCKDQEDMDLSDACVCKGNKYFNDQMIDCLPCAGSCSKCHNTGGNQFDCDSCVNNDPHMDKNKKCQCDAKYYLDILNTKCMACDETCTTCVNKGNDEMKCDKCPDNDMTVNMVTGKCQCKDGQYTSHSLLKCLQCTAPCNLCRGDNNDIQICISCVSPNSMDLTNNCECKPNFFSSPDKEVCYACPLRCPGCKGDANEHPICITCLDPEHMELYDNSHDCVCKAGYFIKTNNIECGVCPGAPCKTCIHDLLDAPECSVCIDEVKMRLTVDRKSCECREQYFMSSNNLNCLDCQAPCKNCFNIGGDIQKCTTCVDNNMESANDCQCKNGFFGSSDKKTCISCPSSCSLCTNNGLNLPVCTECVDPILMEKKNNNCICKDKYYMVEAGNACSVCDDSCNTCSLVGEAGNKKLMCLTCPDPSMTIDLTTGKCVCEPGYYPTKDNKQCKLCRAPCLSCRSKNDDNDQECTACIDTDMVLAEDCHCRANMRLSHNRNDCIDCPITCNECISDSVNEAICTVCADVFMVVSYDWKTCVCRDGYFMWKNSKVCYPCGSKSCLYCDNNGNDEPFCIKCQDKQMYIQKDGTCACNLQYYMSMNKFDCLHCPAKCINCVGDFNDKPVCHMCRDEKDMDPANNCECKPGYYSNQVGDDCIMCPLSCKACKGQDNKIVCSSCQEPDMILSDECACPSGTAMSLDFKKCLKCSEDGSCMSCTDNTGYLQCTRCIEPGMTIVDNKCICPHKNYFDKICKPCYSGCDTCSGPSSKQCLSCVNIKHMVLKDGACVCEGSYKYENGECIYNKSSIVIYVVVGLIVLLLGSLIFVLIAALCS